ncbi:MAG: SDR family oxidoreductase [Novosphingobium sp.]|nr:SDR family oxidoreductase [Novosphingobium sp.]
MNGSPGNSQPSHLLVAGASGVIGSAAVEHFASLPGWRVTALSRRKPAVAAGARFDHLALDLGDRAACADAVSRLPAVTHLVYAAVAEAPGLASGWRDDELIRLNGEMFANLLAPLAQSGNLRHASILQGTKAYGAHVHAVEVPLRESQPRDDHSNFYWLHEDTLREVAGKAGFTFTIFRPQVLLGSAPGAAMNPVAPIGAYAAICRERELPFAMPGDSEALWEMVDAGLMAEALAWAAMSPQAAGEIFNITNGDLFVLRHAWPALAEALDLPTDGDAPDDLAGFFALPENQSAWARIAERHQLAEPSLDALLGQSHHYLDLLIGPRIATRSNPALLSTIKIRRAGFSACRDSLDSLIHKLGRMVQLRLLPPMGRFDTGS